MTLSPDDFMQLAVIEAKKALALNEVPVGAIVIKENKVIGAGFNSVIRDHSVTAHAEINAMVWNPVDPDWIAICARNRTQVLRI